MMQDAVGTKGRATGAKQAPAVVDVFCGVGGLSHGFYKEGFDVRAGIDVDLTCKYPFETNNGARFVGKSIENVTSKQVNRIFGKTATRVLVGCAPCQPFSVYNRKKKNNDKWKLLLNFADLVSRTQPDVVSMENVPQIRSHSVFKKFVSALKRSGYVVSEYVVYCPDYGIPQGRKRLVLFASKYGKVELLPKTHSPKEYKTLGDAISKLKAIKAGDVDPTDPLHRCRNLGELNLRRIRSTPEGGAWESWDDSLKLKCHKKKGGKSFRCVYGRMRWDKPSSTITTEFCNLGTGRFGHPEQDRTISLREAAVLQTFPKYYRFYEEEEDITFAGLARLIGNAVPVRLARVVARSIRRHLEQVDKIVIR